MSGEDRLVVAEAIVLLPLAWTALRVLSFHTIRRLLQRVHSSSYDAARGSIDRIGWAVSAVARRLPGSMTCLVKALAAETMLRRRGYNPHLRIGIRKTRDERTPLNAHAWVECEGAVVVGAVADLADYVVLSPTNLSRSSPLWPLR